MNESKPTVGERIRLAIEFVFGFANRRGTVIDGWICSAPGLTLSSQEFYDALRARIDASRFPGVDLGQIAFFEGGPLSDRRTYLRARRERIFVFTCAAPFGDHFFFSCRVIKIPVLLRLWHLLAAGASFSLLWPLLVYLAGFIPAIVLLATLALALVTTLRNASADGSADFDSLLLHIPVVATFYEDWFRNDTFYRLDTRTMYVKLLPQMILKAAEEVCAEKGVSLVRQDGDSPVMKSMIPAGIR